MGDETSEDLVWLKSAADEFDKDFYDDNQKTSFQEQIPADLSTNERFSGLSESASKTGRNESATNASDEGGGFFTNESSLICDECEQRFEESWLKKTFDCSVCDECRDKDGKHGLITKTDACKEYLLRDEDFFSRQPALKFISKKNPHNERWGIMKLFLRCQVEDRALEIWGTEEALEAEIEKREEKKTKSKKRTFDKMIKELRMNARSSIKTPKRSTHDHEFGEESFDEEQEVYHKKCKICDYVSEYEKM